MFDSDSTNSFPQSFSPLTNSGLHLQPTDELSLKSLNKQLSSPQILGEISQELIDIKSVVLSGNSSLMTLCASPLGQEFDSLKTNKSSVDELTGEILSNSNHPILEQALQSTQNDLKGLAKDADFNAKMNLAFGNHWNAEVFSNLVKDFAKGNFSQLPVVEILPSAAINGANGGFASVTNTIYLAKEFVEQNAGNPGAITSVLLEEIGHYIDSKVNVADAAGDEGDIFARVVEGKAISAGELLELKGEDDTALVTIGGKDISIEKSQIAMTSIGDTLYQSHRGLDNKIYTRFSKGFTPDGEGVIWSDWTKTTSGTTYSAPSLETFKGKLYQSVRGADDKIYTRFSNSISPDGIEWSSWIAADAPARTKNAIALEVFQDKLYQSHRGFDNKIYTRSTSDGLTWSGWTATTSGITYSAPSLEAFGNNKLYQSHRGTDDKIYSRFTSNGSTWSEWKESGGTTYSTPDLEEFKGKLYQSHRGTDDKIYTRFSSNGINWSDWKEAGGETPTAPTLETVGNKLFQSHQGLNQKIYTRFSKSVASNGEVTWSPWKESGGETPLDRDDFSVVPTGEFNVEYYNNKDLSGAPTVITKESNIDKNWGDGGPGKTIGNDNFSVRWTGKFNFDQGNYVFKVKGDDGFKLWVDNKLVIDGWKDQTVTEKPGDFTLSKGIHEVKVEYYEKTGSGQVKAWWEKGGGTPNPNYIYKQADYLNTLYQDNTNNRMTRTVHDKGTSAFDSVDGDSDNRVYTLVGGEVIEAKNGKQFPTAVYDNWVYNGTVAIYNKELNKTFIYWHFGEGSIDESLQGKTIAPGSLIGREGKTGYSDGVHTHVQVHEGRVKVDMSNPNAPIAPAPSSRLNVESVFQEAVRKGLVKLYK